MMSGIFLRPIVPERMGSRMSREWMHRIETYSLQPATFWRRNSKRLNEKLKYTRSIGSCGSISKGARRTLSTSPTVFCLYRIQPGSLTFQDRPLRREEIYRIVAENGDLIDCTGAVVLGGLEALPRRTQKINTDIFRTNNSIRKWGFGEESLGRANKELETRLPTGEHSLRGPTILDPCWRRPSLGGRGAGFGESFAPNGPRFHHRGSLSRQGGVHSPPE